MRFSTPPIADCSKCGQTGEKHRLRFVAARTAEELANPDYDFKDKLEREHLRITCGRCHYEWNADCIDKPALSVPPDNTAGVR